MPHPLAYQHLQSCARCAERASVVDEKSALVQDARSCRWVPPQPEQETVEELIERLKALRASLAAAASAGADAAGEVVALLAPPQDAGEIGRLGPYSIVRVLGQGGMGIVFLAQQARLRRLVALKMILSGPRTGRERLARFQSETEVVARLSHANVVQVYDAGDHDGRPYFTMEHIESGSLADRLAAAPLSPVEAARLVQTLARAVQHAHEHGLVHRDLKPSNVLLAADGTPKISDFGLAKQLEGVGATAAELQTETGAILGTPAYMAPEQAADSRAVGAAADVYALVAILYECLTGRPPFKAASVLQTLEQVRSQEPVPPGRLQPGLPRDLQTICLKCLHKEPARRYATVGALADDRARFLDGEPIHARPVSRLERLWKWARLRPALAGLLTVSGLSLVAIVGSTRVYNARLRQAVEQAQAKQAAAQHEHALALARHRDAADTLEKMLSRLESEHRADAPTLKELRQKLLEDSLAFYQKSLDGADDPDPAVRLDAARAYWKTGAIQLELSQPVALAASLRRAVSLVEELSVEYRDGIDGRLCRSDCYTDLGSLALNAGRPEEAQRHYQAAWTFYDSICHEQPDAPPGSTTSPRASTIWGWQPGR